MGDMAVKSDLFAVKSNAAIPPKRTLASVLLEAILGRSALTFIDKVSVCRELTIKS